MSDSRYVSEAYNMMVHENNTNCWSNEIKEILYRFHLKELWNGGMLYQLESVKIC